MTSTTKKPLRSRVRNFARRLSGDTSGLALVEFAFAAPIVLGLGMLGTDTAFLVITHMQVSQIAMQVADNASRVGEQDVLTARKVFERWRQLSSGSNWSSIPPARQASAEGRCDEVERLLDALPADDVPQRWHILMMLGRRADADQVLMKLERSGNVQGLAGFLSYRHFDPAPFPSLMQMLAREGIRRPPAEPLPFACRPVATTP